MGSGRRVGVVRIGRGEEVMSEGGAGAGVEGRECV